MQLNKDYQIMGEALNELHEAIKKFSDNISAVEDLEMREDILNIIAAANGAAFNKYLHYKVNAMRQGENT